MKCILTCVFIMAAIIFNTFLFYSMEKELDDCLFERNHYKITLDRCRELSDYAEILAQLPPRVLAQLKTANEMIKQKRHKEYEAVEQPLLTKKEKK